MYIHHEESLTINKHKYISNYRFGYSGGTFLQNEIEDALENGYPLTLDIAIPGSCLNNCIYCGYYEINHNNKLSIEEINTIIKQFKRLGGKSIKILGEGEPLLRKDIFLILKEIKDNQLIPVLFTCGDVIGDENLAYKIHQKSSKELVDLLYSLNCTIMLKYEADGVAQDEIVQRKNYSVKRDRAIELILNKGFNRTFPTRIGFGSVLLKKNSDSIKNVFDNALDKNIYPLICPLMPIGKMGDSIERERLSPSKDFIGNLKKDLAELKIKNGINDKSESDFPGGLPCDISRTGFYIDDVGNVFICESDQKVGNIRENALKHLWKKIDSLKWQKYGKERCLGLCQPKRRAGIL